MYIEGYVYASMYIPVMYKKYTLQNVSFMQ